MTGLAPAVGAWRTGKKSRRRIPGATAFRSAWHPAPTC